MQPSSESAAAPTVERGIALPGDRGPRTRASDDPRPSFWRRIALGRRRAKAAKVAQPDTAIARAGVDAGADTSGIERRIVEPLLQALVSVEAKLERSHIDLSKRSDQVEQRLTQLWDIEAQLDTIIGLQESLLAVSKQQQRLESAVNSQTRTLRRLVGAIIFSLAATVALIALMMR